jgi:hypothetical protein
MGIICLKSSGVPSTYRILVGACQVVDPQRVVALSLVSVK